jgi:uncharacterized protein YueI
MTFDYLITNPPFSINKELNRNSQYYYMQFLNSYVKRVKNTIWILPESWYYNNVVFKTSHQILYGKLMSLILVGVPEWQNIDAKYIWIIKTGDSSIVHFRVPDYETTIPQELFWDKILPKYKDIYDWLKTPFQCPICQQKHNHLEKRCEELYFDEYVLSSNLFNIKTNSDLESINLQSNDIQVITNRGLKFTSINRIPKHAKKYVDKWKIVTKYTTSENIEFILVEPNKVVSESFLVVYAADTQDDAIEIREYLNRPFIKRLINSIRYNRHITKTSFCYVPKKQWNSLMIM